MTGASYPRKTWMKRVRPAPTRRSSMDARVAAATHRYRTVRNPNWSTSMSRLLARATLDIHHPVDKERVHELSIRERARMVGRSTYVS